ncbi:DNA repair protein rad50 [Phlyctochytrium planicorne]|nr:DNA repair protein rad50 [Phlyctochytrium planicorne]
MSSLRKHGFKDPRTDNLEVQISTTLRLKEEEDIKISREMDALKNEISMAASKVEMLSNSHASKEQELQKMRALMRKVCKEEEFMGRLDKAEKEYEQSLNSERTFASASSIFQKYVTIFEECKKCPLCLRAFATEPEGDEFLIKLKQTLSKISPNEEGQVATLQEKSAEFKRLKGLKPVWSDIERLRDVELPKLKKDFEVEQSRLAELRKRQPKLEGLLVNSKSVVESLQKIKREYNEAVQLKSDADIVSIQVESLESELMGQSSTKNAAQLQEESDAISSKSKEILKERERIQQAIRLNYERIKDCESLIKELSNKKQLAQANLNERTRLESEIQEVSGDILKIQEELNVSIPGLSKSQGQQLMQPELLSVRNSLDILKERRATEEREFNQKSQKAQQFQSTLRNIETDLLKATRLNPKSAVEECEQSLAKCHRSIQNLTADITSAKDKITKMNQDHSEVAVTLRNVQDNLKLRSLREEKQELDRKIASLESEIRAFKEPELKKRLKSLTAKYEGYCNELAELSGQVRQMEEQLKDYKIQYDEEYKDSVSKFIDESISLKTEIAVTEDVDMSIKAIESGILKYHSLKMSEINKTIKELWVNTYRGNDIEYIEIRADNENVKGRSSYNYRLVMVKERTEIDMRGRCSAGQKVLASIIIRLALAETVGLSCGILALDEPSTNLDAENAQSLAESLVNLIKARKNQKNFQLIIITHDEEFLKLLGKREFAEHYYRVAKDDDTASYIDRIEIVS